MGKLNYLLFFSIFFYHSVAWGFNLDNIMQNDLQLLERFLYADKATFKTIDPKILFSKYENDPKNLIEKEFKIIPFYKNRVAFWFSIYTQYNSNHSVLHDKENLKIVYDVLDFGQLATSILNKHTKFAIQNRIVREKTEIYKKSFTLLVKGKTNNQISKRIQQAIIRTGIKIPKNPRKRRLFWLKKSKNFRAQTGQKDNIQQGLINLRPYKDTIEDIFTTFKLPRSLLAVSFLESSFNIHAYSKVGATGAWQFMKNIGKHFMVVNNRVDQRLNPLVSTVAALHLLDQNKKLLKHWDLAVSAYNNGTGLLQRGVRRLKKRKVKNPKLHHLIQKFKHRNFGFAAQNFYSEFLALVYTLAYRKDFFPKKVIKESHQKTQTHIYISKCKVKPRWFIKTLKKKDPFISISNNHFIKRYRRKLMPKGTVFISRIKLNPKKYYKVSYKNMLRHYPRNWPKLVAKMSCRK